MEGRRQRHSSNAGRQSDAEYELSRAVERLQRDLTRRDRELEEERGESGRAMERVQRLEKERLELKRELEDVRDEAAEYQRLVEEMQEERDAGAQRGVKRKGEEIGEEQRNDQENRIKELQEEVNEKNREIGQLVEDLEKIEDEKVLLKTKLTDLSDSLQDATVQLERMARDSFDLKSKLEKVDEKVRKLEEEKTVLEIRERELLAFKERHDQYLENLCQSVDIRVDVWKKMIFQKDEEIDRLNTKIGALVSQIPAPQIDSEKTTVQQLRRKLQEREEQISLLTDKLYQATEELNTNTKALEECQAKVQRSERGEETERLLRAFEKKVRKRDAQIQHLNEGLHASEREAEEKARELVEVLTRLNRYEAGEYGLPQAVTEIKELKTQVRLRNTQIESLTQDVNRLHLDQTQLVEENEMLREKLGLQYDSNLVKERKIFVQNKRAEIEALRVKVELLENEIIHVKTKNYGLRKELGALQNQGYVHDDNRQFERHHQAERSPQHSHPQATQPEHRHDRDALAMQIIDDWKGKYDVILNENTELRKGFQEILESIHRLSEEGTSTVKVESPILENLLREMSARGLINYPYAISSFHLKVCNLEGKNSELREELHRMRREEKLLRAELIEAKAAVQIMEDRLRNAKRSRSKSPDSPRAPRPRSRSREQSPKSIAPPDEPVATVASALAERHSLVLDDLQKEIEQLRDDNNNIRIQCDNEKSTLENRLRVLVEKGNDLFADKGISESEKTRRKFNYLNVLRAQQVAEIEALHKKVAEVENASLSKISFLERFKAKSLQQIATLQQLLESSVPIAVLQSTKKELLELTNRYQDLHLRNEKMALEYLRKEKPAIEALELKDLNRKLELELDRAQAKLARLSSASATASQSSGDSASLEAEVEELSKQVTRLTNLLQASVAEARLGQEYKAKAEEWVLQAARWEQREKELNFRLSNTVPREEHDQLNEKLLKSQDWAIRREDETEKWKEMAEVLQNQVNALNTIKDFERMELESLLSQVTDLQAADLSKGEMARVKHELIAAEKEKHLALQQVQKLTSKLAQLEGAQLHQDKVFLDREMSLIANHAQVITRYRTLFTAFHEFSIVPTSRNYCSAKDVAEAWELLRTCEAKAERLEQALDQERDRAIEFQEKASSLEEVLNAARENKETELNFEFAQRVQESRVEVSRWKRRSEQQEREIIALHAHLHRAESYAAELDEDRIRLEHSMELKDSLAATFLTSDKLLGGVIPVHRTASATDLGKPAETQPVVETANKIVQTEDEDSGLSSVSAEELLADLAEFREKVVELENLLRAKDEVINNFRLVNVEPVRAAKSEASMELEESLQVARETMASLNERLKAKDDNLNQYKKLLADVRAELTSGTERHVQEMKALQITIHQQQQAFTRMKSTLSHPVKDSSSIDSTIKEQLTRINELEDEVSELQHALGNVASQLTAARSDAHRWRSTADSRLKEMDALREDLQSTNQADELSTLREKVRMQHERIMELQNKSKELSATVGIDPPNPNPMTVMVHMLEEKDRQLEAYAKAATDSKSSHKVNERIQIEERLSAREKEIEGLRTANLDLQHKLAALQVKVSKLNASNQRSGVTAELEDLRTKLKASEETKDSLQKKLDDIERITQIEEEKKRKTIDGFARWEEGKKWKKTVEKLEAKIKEMEDEATKMNKTAESLRNIISRLEREKIVLESKGRGSSAKGGKSSKEDSVEPPAAVAGLIEKLRIEISDLNELVEKTEFEGREEAERLKMEVKILKDRIVSQERQLTAYQVAQKGDPKMVHEIEKMAANEEAMQKEIIHLEEENLHLKLQIEQLRLDTPRLRDRVQHLQKLVEVLKTEKPRTNSANKLGNATQSSSQRSLGELERTISALKSVIEKLQTENKRLKIKPGTQATKQSTSSEKLKASLETLMGEKKELLDQIHHLERERSKLNKMYLEGTSRMDAIQIELSEAEQRAKSAEMKLKTFLGKSGQAKGADTVEDGVKEEFEANALVYKQMKALKEELDRKDKLLAEAKVALQEAAAGKVVPKK